MAAVPSIGRASFVESPGVAPQAAATQGLYERHAAKIQSYCHHQLGSREEAEDAVQTTFMNAFRALGRGVVPEAESAWLFKIAENVCLSRRRSSWRRGRIESANDFEVIEELVPGPSRQHDELIGIEDALASMPEQQRRAILLREWQGLSYREVAEELEISQSAVETLIFRARRSLAQGLEQPDSIKPKRKSFRRALHALDLSTAIGALKTLLAGSAAVKATAAAVAVTAAAGTAATVTPKLEGKLPGTHAKPALKAPAVPSPVVASSAASASVSRVTFVDESGSRSVVLTGNAGAADAAARSVRQGGSGPVGALKGKHSAAAGSSAGHAAPNVVDTDVPVTPHEAATPVAETPAAVAPAAEPAAAPVQPSHEARRPEETQRGEAKREETKKPVVQPRSETKTDTKKEVSATNDHGGNGQKDEGRNEESSKAEPRKQAAAAPAKEQNKREREEAARREREVAKQENKDDEGKRDGGSNGNGSANGSNRGQVAEPQAIVATPAPVAVVTTTTTIAASTAAPVVDPAVVPAVAPAAAPAPEAKGRDRDRERDKDRERSNGDNGNGKRKGK